MEKMCNLYRLYDIRKGIDSKMTALNLIGFMMLLLSTYVLIFIYGLVNDENNTLAGGEIHYWVLFFIVNVITVLALPIMLLADKLYVFKNSEIKNLYKKSKVKDVLEIYKVLMKKNKKSYDFKKLANNSIFYIASVIIWFVCDPLLWVFKKTIDLESYSNLFLISILIKSIVIFSIVIILLMLNKSLKNLYEKHKNKLNRDIYVENKIELIKDDDVIMTDNMKKAIELINNGYKYNKKEMKNFLLSS